MQQAHLRVAKPKEPPVYTGTREGPETWLFQVEQYLKSSTVEGEMAVRLAAGYLQEHAAVWWQRQVQRAEAGQLPPIVNFVQFREGLLKHFGRPDHETAVREKLASCVQRTSVRDFVSRLRQLDMQLASYPDAELLSVFKRGLKDAVKWEVYREDPKTFDEAVSIAERMDELTYQLKVPNPRMTGGTARNNQPRFGRYDGQHDGEHTPPQANGPAPMELGMMISSRPHKQQTDGRRQ